MSPTRTLSLLLAIALGGGLLAACGSSTKPAAPVDRDPPPPCQQVTDCPAVACQVASCNGACAYVDAVAATTCDDGQGGKVCDGAGACVECNRDFDCQQSANVCTVSTSCIAHTCNPVFSSGTPPPDKQTPNDCLKILCDPLAPDGLTLNFAPEDIVTTTANPCSTLICYVPPQEPVSAATTIEQLLLGTGCPGGMCDPAGVCSATP